MKTRVRYILLAILTQFSHVFLLFFFILFYIFIFSSRKIESWWACNASANNTKWPNIQHKFCIVYIVVPKIVQVKWFDLVTFSLLCRSVSVIYFSRLLWGSGDICSGVFFSAFFHLYINFEQRKFVWKKGVKQCLPCIKWMNAHQPTGVIKGFNETTDKGLFCRVTLTLSVMFAEPLPLTL